MSKTADVYKFAQSFSSEHSQLNVLVNNAGCMVLERKLLAGDVETNFATNTLGTYVLTKELLPLLMKSSNPRVVITVCFFDLSYIQEGILLTLLILSDRDYYINL